MVCFFSFLNGGVDGGLQHALLLLRAAVFSRRPCRLFEQGSEEIMFWPFGVNGVLKSIFLENEFLEQFALKMQVFFMSPI